MIKPLPTSTMKSTGNFLQTLEDLTDQGESPKPTKGGDEAEMGVAVEAEITRVDNTVEEVAGEGAEVKQNGNVKTAHPSR